MAWQGTGTGKAFKDIEEKIGGIHVYDPVQCASIFTTVATYTRIRLRLRVMGSTELQHGDDDATDGKSPPAVIIIIIITRDTPPLRR